MVGIGNLGSAVCGSAHCGIGIVRVIMSGDTVPDRGEIDLRLSHRQVDVTRDYKGGVLGLKRHPSNCG